ncbi:NAD-dependent deacylase [Mycolicibacterium sphagni]|uniref:protein acetyllysine N-acetyltransferase n=2 Tax=Mycolicibacterium sphagni TaxID=1786 RepID=A0ABX2JZ74_9MYCO|nr:NAD-dependent deacylase [Mycolicibacterium sphagni]
MTMQTVVVLTGAGISAESGLSTFRGPDGLWEGHRVVDVATPQAFDTDPVTVHRFYNRLRRRLRDDDVAPNAAHCALARLERALGRGFHLVTQNIDDLHQRAGNTQITAMHGELTKIRNVDTGDVLPWAGDVIETDRQWRPHVVWFGERTIGLESVVEILSTASIFVAIGTSGTVHPASQFAAIAKTAGATTVEINIEPSAVEFDYRVIGAASERVPELVDQLINGLVA